MKNKNLHARISEKRMQKLKTYANHKDKTVTQLIEDWIDRLPLPEGLEVSVPPTSRRGTPRKAHCGYSASPRYSPLGLKVGTSALALKYLEQETDWVRD